MEIKVNIDEERLLELVAKEVAKELIDFGALHHEFRTGVKNGVVQSTKELIYSQKDEIIEKVIQRATVEITKKGLPKLLDRLD